MIAIVRIVITTEEIIIASIIALFFIGVLIDPFIAWIKKTFRRRKK